MAEHHGASPSTTPVQRPKIKIIHIIAPEIIKTDVANFRELVQRLTGKTAGTAAGPAEEELATVAKKRPRTTPAPAPVMETSDFVVQQEESKKRKIKCEVKVEDGGFGDYSLERNELWMDLNPGGFLSFLEEQADVFQGLAAADHDFLQMPLGFGSSRMDLVGEMYAS